MSNILLTPGLESAPALRGSEGFRAGNHWGHADVNPLQQLIADAMAAAGMPLDKRGSRAELSRRAGVEDAIISNLLNRPRYVPDEGVRQKLATALGIPRAAIDSAAAQIKGLRVYPVGDSGEYPHALDAVRAALALSSTDLTQRDLEEIDRRLAEIAEEIERRAKGGQSDKP